MHNDKTSACRVISCVNQKGGVGKSVTSTNLGIGLARMGQKVLIADLDSQASQTISLGWKMPDELPVTITAQLSKVIENKPLNPLDGILSHAEGVDLMPSSIELSSLEMRMMNTMSREFILREYLSVLKPHYDAIVLDCPPTLGLMTVNALTASDSVIIPVQPEYLSVVGMTQLFDTIGQVQKHINPELRIEGVLITLANMRTNLAKNTLSIIQDAYGGGVHIFPHPIPYSTKVKEASAAGKSIFEYDKKGNAAYAYGQLAKEVYQNGRQIGANIRVTKKVEPSR
ncbi:MAG: AAA family ATPase [Oscillospiraceae bacterium]|nr:AAA family ATPase [Oscillospiraceae bacterium]MCL2279656.1 AAA family ATPase [Oscillospiraceae bacterium]